jgi:hypothetical protein
VCVCVEHARVCCWACTPAEDSCDTCTQC